MRNEPTGLTLEPAPSEPTSESEDTKRSRFAKKLVQVPKKEIDEKAEEWKRKEGANASLRGGWQ
jgi:hypothetical protein